MSSVWAILSFEEKEVGGNGTGALLGRPEGAGKSQKARSNRYSHFNLSSDSSRTSDVSPLVCPQSWIRVPEDAAKRLPDLLAGDA